MIRPPAVASTFYAGTSEDLKKQIENCFSSKIGPGSLPSKGEGTKILAGVVPHAGYVYSGPVAAHLYKKIGESKQGKTYIILGPNHSGIGAPVSCMLGGAWATPLGQAKINTALAKKIIDNSNVAEMDEMAHMQEHSIEVQLPFLQYVQKDFDFVPICMLAQDQDTAESLGKTLAQVCEKETVTVLASSDFTHYEPHPVASEKDKKAIDAITVLDSVKFQEILVQNNMSVCGYGPITVALTYAKELGVKKGTLLKYATSGDVTGDKTAVVGYASIEF